MNPMTLKLVLIVLTVMVLYSCGGVKNTVMGNYSKQMGHNAYEQNDYSEALTRFSEASEYGNAEAQYYLSYMLLEGKGTEKDEKAAIKLMQKSANGGFSPAQVQMGLRHLFGNGVSQDGGKAYTFLLEAAESDDADAQYFTGFMSATGHGTEKNEEEALRWFRLAKSNGFPVPDDLLTLRGVSALEKKKWTRTMSPTPSSMSSERDLIRKIQAGLTRLGYVPGPADGIYGRKTEEAIKAFQTNSGLVVDGRATSTLLERIETGK